MARTKAPKPGRPPLPTEIAAQVAAFLRRDFVDAAAAVGVCRALREAAEPVLRARNPLRALLRREACLQGDLTKALLVKPEAVKAMPHTARTGPGGRVSRRVFAPADVVPALVAATGGVAAFGARLLKQQMRLAAAEAKIEARRATLLRGLGSLRLKLRSDNRVCAAYIDEGTGDLADVLRYTARMHYLHEHTDGEYQAAIEDWVEREAEHEGYYKGIYSEAVDSLRGAFRLPDRLPWLANAPTARAIAAAVAAATGTAVAAVPAAPKAKPAVVPAAPKATTPQQEAIVSPHFQALNRPSSTVDLPRDDVPAPAPTAPAAPAAPESIGLSRIPPPRSSYARPDNYRPVPGPKPKPVVRPFWPKFPKRS